MRALLQRVRSARVVVADEIIGEITTGLCVLVGVTHDDDGETATRMADKLVSVRVFPDAEGRMNESLVEAGGELLLVSQFTLYGDARKGRRPSYVAAAAPDHAEPLVERLAEEIRLRGVTVETGRFGADMQVELVNDGPVTLLLEV